MNLISTCLNYIEFNLIIQNSRNFIQMYCPSVFDIVYLQDSITCSKSVQVNSRNYPSIHLGKLG